MLNVDKDSNLIPFLSLSDYYQYTTTLSTLAMGNHLLFEIEDFKITNVTVLFFKKAIFDEKVATLKDFVSR